MERSLAPSRWDPTCLRKVSQEAFKGHWSLPAYLHLVRAHYGLPATSLHLHRHIKPHGIDHVKLYQRKKEEKIKAADFFQNAWEIHESQSSNITCTFRRLMRLHLKTVPSALGAWGLLTHCSVRHGVHGSHAVPRRMERHHCTNGTVITPERWDGCHLALGTGCNLQIEAPKFRYLMVIT